MIAGKLSDPRVEVALARLQLRRLGYRNEEIHAAMTEDILLETVAGEAVAERAAEEAKVAAWFRRAAQDSTAIRMQPLPEVPDG